MSCLAGIHHPFLVRTFQAYYASLVLVKVSLIYFFPIGDERERHPPPPPPTTTHTQTSARSRPIYVVPSSAFMTTNNECSLALYLQKASNYPLWLFRRAAHYCNVLCSTSTFQNFITSVILVASALVCAPAEHLPLMCRKHKGLGISWEAGSHEV